MFKSNYLRSEDSNIFKHIYARNEDFMFQNIAGPTAQGVLDSRFYPFVFSGWILKRGATPLHPPQGPQELRNCPLEVHPMSVVLPQGPPRLPGASSLAPLGPLGPAPGPPGPLWAPSGFVSHVLGPIGGPKELGCMCAKKRAGLYGALHV